ncbi:MAG: hypothetical protein D6806_04785, partial [Deltaproteobacteria bacterium]
RDNDCNGLVDDGENLCGQDMRCLCGTCSQACQASCPVEGKVCRGGYCVDPCRGMRCPAGRVCVEGTCTDPCAGVDCGDGLSCSMGKCIPADCYLPESSCPAGELCRDGECTGDPCAGVSCPQSQYCKGGRCIPLACGSCLADEICYQGSCLRSLCASMSCVGPGLVCMANMCVADPCEGVNCREGFACMGGQCVEDECLAIRCPEGSYCEGGICVVAPENRDGGSRDDEKVQPDGSDGAQDADGGSGADWHLPRSQQGCGCETASRSAASLLQWLLAGLVLLASRPRS